MNKCTYTLDDYNVKHFMHIFEGHINNHYYYKSGVVVKDKKETGAEYKCANKPVVPNLFVDHLNGSKGLGLILINEDNKAKLGCIDVDLYDPKHDSFKQDVLDAISRWKLPVTPCSSRSGGLHLYITYDNFISAEAVVEDANRLASLLGINTYVKNVVGQKHKLEINPKQTKATKKGGSSILLPYYDANNPRSAVILDGKKLSLADGLKCFQENTTTHKKIESICRDELPGYGLHNCCRRRLVLGNVPEGERNKVLYGIGLDVYSKDADSLPSNLPEFNEIMNKGEAPLPPGNVDSIIKSIQDNPKKFSPKHESFEDWYDTVLDKIRRDTTYCGYKELQSVQLYIKQTEGIVKYKSYSWDVVFKGTDELITLDFASAGELDEKTFRLKFLSETDSMLKQIGKDAFMHFFNEAAETKETIITSRYNDLTNAGALNTTIAEFLHSRSLSAAAAFDTKKPYFGKCSCKCVDQHEDAYWFCGSHLREFLKDNNFDLSNGMEARLNRGLNALCGKSGLKRFKGVNDNNQIRVYKLTVKQAAEVSPIIKTDKDKDHKSGLSLYKSKEQEG